MSDLDRLLDGVRRGRLSRRQFFQRGVALGLSATALGSLLAACGEEEEETPAAMDTTLPEEITFFNWADYLDPSLKEKFESETGIKVNETFFDTNDDLLAKMKAGAAGYDVICPGGYIVSIMQKSGMLQPIDMSMIPSFSGIIPALQKPVFDDPDQQDGDKYSVPYMFGNAGIGVRTDKVSEAVTSWATMWDPKYEGQITMLSAERTVIGEALKFIGYSINTTDQAELDEATAKLIEQKPLVLKYEASGLPRTMAEGIPLVNCYDGDASIAKRELGAELLDYVVPSEGAVFWVDNLSIPKDAPSPYGAHLFIEFLTKPENSAQNSTWIGYQTASEEAFALIEDEIIISLRPTEEQWAAGEIVNDLGEFNAQYTAAWRDVKAA
jgi:spermidine/putrescine transport system substrate-binding protein